MKRQTLQATLALVGTYLLQAQAVSLQTQSAVVTSNSQTQPKLISLAQTTSQAQAHAMVMNSRAARRQRIKNLRTKR